MPPGGVISGAGHFRQPAVLLVEDDVLIRFFASDVLRDEGYHVLEAADAGEALALLATGIPLDLVLTDIRMPGTLNGVALTYAIKETRPLLPVVLISSHLPPDTPHAGDGFLPKPYGPDQLLEIVEEMIGPEWQTRRTHPEAS
jgi:CheY-like chemotaxis protein